jgi:hypothetical protein
MGETEQAVRVMWRDFMFERQSDTGEHDLVSG